MNRSLYLCLVTLAIAAGTHLNAQTVLKTQLEVNLGGLAVDCYDWSHTISECGVGVQPSSTEPACANGSDNYRTCMQQVLIDYNKQGVIGVRIYFGMNGDGFSTPFLAGNPITFDQQGWLTKLSNFLQDVQAAHIPYVSFTPAWVPWAADGNMSIYAIVSGSSGSYSINTNCTAATANAVFYPWLPWGAELQPEFAEPGPNRPRGHAGCL